MPRAFKITLIVIAAIVVIGLIVPFFIDVDRYRPQIIAQIESTTGRKVEIGHIGARLIPTPGFTVEKVTVGPPAGFAPVNLLTVDSVKGSVSLLPYLLHGTVEVNSIEIVNPHITLATDEHGHTNYEFPSSESAKKAPAPSSAPPQVAVDSVSLRDAELIMVDVRGRNPQPASVKVTGFSAEFSNIDLSPKGMARWKGEIPLSGLKAEVTGMPTVSFRSGKVKIDSGDISGDCEIELPKVATVKGSFSVIDFPKMLENPSANRGQVLGSGKFTSDKIHYAPYELTNLTMDLKAYADHIEAPISVSLYGGTFSVNPRLDTAPSASGARHFTAGVQLSQLDLEKLADADPGTKGKLTGHAEAKLQLAGALGGDLMGSLTGQGNFALHDGKVSGIEAAKSMATLTKLAPGLSSAGNLLEATYSSVEGDLNIHGGRIYTTKTEALTNRGKGDIHGSVGFDQTLDLSGTWTLAGGESSGGGGNQSANPVKAVGGLFGKVAKHTVGELPIPFTVKGTVKSPKVFPGGG
ncbi:MAG TPA: AsmA family protein [Candidatus Acidoferrales bacterium]|nr:AsmA family protein [Candidatus Acidoferrales bacterium]